MSPSLPWSSTSTHGRQDLKHLALSLLECLDLGDLQRKRVDPVRERDRTPLDAILSHETISTTATLAPNAVLEHFPEPVQSGHTRLIALLCRLYRRLRILHSDLLGLFADIPELDHEWLQRVWTLADVQLQTHAAVDGAVGLDGPYADLEDRERDGGKVGTGWVPFEESAELDVAGEDVAERSVENLPDAFERGRILREEHRRGCSRGKHRLGRCGRFAELGAVFGVGAVVVVGGWGDERRSDFEVGAVGTCIERSLKVAGVSVLEGAPLGYLDGDCAEISGNPGDIGNERLGERCKAADDTGKVVLVFWSESLYLGYARCPDTEEADEGWWTVGFCEIARWS